MSTTQNSVPQLCWSHFSHHGEQLLKWTVQGRTCPLLHKVLLDRICLPGSAIPGGILPQLENSSPDTSVTAQFHWSSICFFTCKNRGFCCTVPGVYTHINVCMSVCCVASVVSYSLRPYASVLCPWDSPGKNTGVGCLALLQGIFLT